MLYIPLFYICICPYETIVFFVGKCSLKLIQYMSCEKPAISAPLPANVNIDGGTGNLFANTEQEWFQCLEKVYSKHQEFETIGVANKERVHKFYSIEANYQKYLDIFAML